MFAKNDHGSSLRHPRRWWILAVLLLAECIDLLDATIVNVALPSIRSSLHASSTQLVWIAGGYPLAVAIALILGARLGDLYGRRRLFVTGTAGFTLASAACGLAPSAGALIGLRLAQGAFAALMIPQGLSILRTIFPKDELPKALGIFGPVIGSAAIVGPILGGALIDLHLFGTAWRLVFYVNVPLGALAVAGALWLMPETRAPHARRLDLLGTLLVSSAMGAIVYPLTEGRDAGWPAWGFALLAGGIGLLLAFAWQQERRVRAKLDPLVEPSLFRNRSYTSGLAVLTVFFSAISGFMLTLTLYLQAGEHYSPLRAGLSLAPWAFGTALGAGLGAALLAPRFGRKVLQLGALVAVAGIALLIAVAAAGGHTSIWQLLPGVLILGLGFGLVIAPLFDFVLTPVSDAELGSAAGVGNAMQQLAGSIGVAALGTVFFAAVGSGHFHRALGRTLWIELALFALAFALTPLLPAKARNAEEALLAEPV